MPATSSRSMLWAVLTLPCLASCSDSEETLRTSAGEQTREFSEADKIAARALSIGDRTVIAEAASPYAQALLCRNSIEEIAERFQQGGMSVELLHGIEQSLAFYDRQVRSLGGGEGKSESDIRRDLAQTAGSNPDASANGRIAIACLRDLQQQI